MQFDRRLDLDIIDYVNAFDDQTFMTGIFSLPTAHFHSCHAQEFHFFTLLRTKKCTTSAMNLSLSNTEETLKFIFPSF